MNYHANASSASASASALGSCTSPCGASRGGSSMPIYLSQPTAIPGIMLKASVSRGMRTRFRFWLGTHILLLSACVMGCDINVSVASAG